MNDTSEFDAIVVGSGATGGFAAKELCEAGLKVLVLERGRSIQHSIDYAEEFVKPWERANGGRADQGRIEREYAPYAKYIGRRTEHFYHKFEDAPYINDPSKPFTWVRPGTVGGKSLFWGRQVYRWSDLDFEANMRDGHGIDWPIRYRDIEPWYSHVERFIGVSGSAENLPQLPDGEFLPPMEMNAAEKIVKKGIENRFSDRKLIIGRIANLTEARPEQGRGQCQYRAQCSGGCSFSAYYSSLTVTLPAAEKTGNLTLLPNSVVASLEYDATSQRATGVRVIDTKTKVARVYRSKIIFLCASTIASTQILMNSRSSATPEGLGGSSGALGRYLMDHTWGTRIQGLVPGIEDRITRGRRPTGIYVPRFRNIGTAPDKDVDFVRGYNFQGGARNDGWAERAAATPGFGAAFKRGVQTPGSWRFALYGFAECLPYESNVMALADNKIDPYGIPQVRFDVTFRENEHKLVADMLRQGEAMLRAAGLKGVHRHMGDMIPGQGVHEMGTARMGNDPNEAVVNKWNQVHEAKNVFVTDGACMTSSSCVNPTLTFMAITARAANHAVDLLKDHSI